jgi:hypothetical protein
MQRVNDSVPQAGFIKRSLDGMPHHTIEIPVHRQMWQLSSLAAAARERLDTSAEPDCGRQGPAIKES